MTEQPNPAAPRGIFAFTREQWTLAGAGGLIGAALALAITFGAGWLGYFPGASDARIQTYLMTHPDVLISMTNLLQQKEADEDEVKRQAAADKLGEKRFFDPAVAYVTGPKDAKKTLVEFFDYNCPYCKASLPAIKKFYEAHKNDTRFAFIELPVKGPESTVAAQIAIAARRQPDKYIPFYFELMGTGGLDQATIQAAAVKVGLDIPKLTTDMNDPAVTKTIAASLRLAHEALIDGTPTFIVNGKVQPQAGLVTDASLAELAKR